MSKLSKPTKPDKFAADTQKDRDDLEAISKRMSKSTDFQSLGDDLGGGASSMIAFGLGEAVKKTKKKGALAKAKKKA